MAKVLLVSKTSGWDWHGSWFQSQFEKGTLSAEDFGRIKLAHDEHQAALVKTRAALERVGLQYREVNVDQADWMPDADTEYVVTLGGDGTLLAASHKVQTTGIVLIGIRSSGTSVGYLCAGGIDRLDAILEDLHNNRLKILESSRLQVEVYPADGGSSYVTPPALNDFLYSNANPAATTKYRLSLGDRSEVHKSSGLWVSTAVGSSAGIFAAGGVIMPKNDKKFQYVVRELMRASGRNFSLVNGFFDPDEKTLIVENRCESAIVAADGNHGVTRINWGDKFRFHRAAPIRMVHA
jgi:NAD+ kinase